MIRSHRRLATALAGAALTVLAVAGFSSTASAITTPPPTQFNNPCIHLIGTPDPCAIPDPPTPVDPGCLRVDVEPLRCPYQP